VTLELSYVLPLRWDADHDPSEMTRYLGRLSGLVELIVADGSPPEVFQAHAALWKDLCLHVPPEPDLSFLNGKVDGVFTGVRRGSHEAVVIADDDVRYSAAALRRMAALLERYDLVRPQNYFDPMPWHALWDSSRSLLNRAFGGDYPGTLGFKRSFFIEMGGYDGDTMFENLELIRTVAAAGGIEHVALDLFVARIPPSTAGFWAQRVRQAFDDLAMPMRLAGFLSLLPAMGIAVLRRRGKWLAAGALAAIVTAEAGRRRGGGTAVFPAAASAFAPLWMLERGLCSWLALGERVFYGGVRYRRGTIRMAASPKRRLDKRFATGAPPAHPVP
jgi:hypothetical protein